MKTLDDLVVESKLVDVVTGEVIGYILADETYKVAITKKKMLEENMDLASYIDYVDASLVEVVSYNNKYASVDNMKYRLENLSDVPFERLEDGTVALSGYVFDKFRLIELDNDTAINTIKEVLVNG